jgi:preprotein translocase subunit SecY
LIETVVAAFRAPDIRRKLLFTLGILLIFRALTNVPIPNVNTAALTDLFTNNPLLGILNIFSGGGLAAASIIGLGVNPYINASIIMQLMRGVIPALEELSREGEYGRNRINQYTRYLTVPLAFAQGYGISVLLSANGVIPANPLFSIETFSLLLSFTAGTILLMWLGELISEKGLGNGISFIIFAGIVGSIPSQISGVVSGPDALTRLIPFVIIAIVVIAAVVFINEGQRRIPVQYASRVRGRRMYQGQTQYLPLKVTMAGVIPIIFAVSILLFPAQIASYFTASDIDWVRDVAVWISTNLSGQNNQSILLYGSLYFLLVVFFTYFYTAFQFRPDQTADYLRKNGGFIPGIRPGKPTEEFLSRVTNRITLGGALFLGAIAILPYVVSAFVPGTSSLQLGGTSILIMVSVVVETMKQLEAQMMMRHYEGFIR